MTVVLRSFAGELSESNKFEVFMEALQLDDINSNLRRAGEDIAEIEDAVRVDRDALKVGLPTPLLQAYSMLQPLGRWQLNGAGSLQARI